MRSSLRKSGQARPWSASIAAARRRSRKSWPLATICVPTSTAAGSLAKRSSVASRLPRRSVASASSRSTRDVRQQLADGLADALGARAEAGELDRAAVRARARRALRVAAVVAAQAVAGVQREADVAALAAEALAAAAAVQRRRLAAAVEQQDRAPALVGEAHEARAQRPRERIEAVAAQVDDLDARQVAADARRQRRARQARPALRARRGRAHHERGALEPRALGGDAAGVVARVVALLVGRLVLLVDDDQADVGQRREHGRARARRRRARRPPIAASRTARRSPSEMPECSTATWSPKRAAKRRAVCGESAISGTSTSTVRPRASALSAARR